MNFWDKVFIKKRSKENIEAHKVVEEKSAEAHDILNEVQSKLLKVSYQIEHERKRSTKEMRKNSKTLKDVAEKIAFITKGEL